MLFADNFANKFGVRSGQTKRRAWPGSNLFDTRWYSWIFFSKKLYEYEKKSAEDKKAWKNSQVKHAPISEHSTLWRLYFIVLMIYVLVTDFSVMSEYFLGYSQTTDQPTAWQGR